MKREFKIFIVFFLLTIGNGSFIQSKFGNSIEFLGLVLLLLFTILSYSKNINSIFRLFRLIFFSFILSLGAFYNDISTNYKIMIFMSSFLLMTYSDFSNNLIKSNNDFKIIGNSLVYGMVFNSIIGFLTGTLGLFLNSSEAIIKVLFLS